MFENIKQQRISKKKGFTLVELLVTITMFVIITGVVLVNSNQFDSTVLLHNFAYDVALTIKQAQSYGVNVRESSSGSFDYSYGVRFDLTQSPTNFVLFTDINNSSSTNSVVLCPANDPSSECLQKYSMQKGTHVLSMCAGANESSCSTADQLSILFHRPNLKALIYYGSGGTFVPTEQSYAEIVLASADNATSTVVVTSIGQIYVK